jgi:hypothetical protein
VNHQQHHFHCRNCSLALAQNKALYAAQVRQPCCLAGNQEAVRVMHPMMLILLRSHGRRHDHPDSIVPLI